MRPVACSRGWRKLHIKELHPLLSSPKILLLLNQLHKPGWVLACSANFFQASLSSSPFFQFVIFNARRSASASSFHPVLGLPRDLLPVGFHFIIALTFYCPPKIIRVIKSRRTRWTGHVACVGRRKLHPEVW